MEVVANPKFLPVHHLVARIIAKKKKLGSFPLEYDVTGALVGLCRDCDASLFFMYMHIWCIQPPRMCI